MEGSAIYVHADWRGHDRVGVAAPAEHELFRSDIAEPPAFVELSCPHVAIVDAEPDRFALLAPCLDEDLAHQRSAVTSAHGLVAQVDPGEFNWLQAGDAGRCGGARDMRVADELIGDGGNEER